MIRDFRDLSMMPRGLQQFRAWMDPLPHNISPTNIDWMLERDKRLWVMEFKPQGFGAVSRGQHLTLQSLSSRGIRTWLVEDPWATEVLEEPRDRDAHLIYRVYEDGEVYQRTASIEEINQQVKEFVE